MKLMLPTREFLDEIRAYRQEFIESGDSMDGTGALAHMERPEEWLAHTELCRRAATVPDGLVPATQFIFVREEDKRIVGMLQVRHCFNAYLEKFGGNIGYSVRPSERGKAYAQQMLAEALPYCRELGLEQVLVTCDSGNEASRRVILKNGGKYESTVDESDGEYVERYWIKT